MGRPAAPDRPCERAGLVSSTAASEPTATVAELAGDVVHPVILGAGTAFFPGLDASIGLKLIETRTFESGVVYLGYAAT